jgi:DNA invertase Pin-like site-specific DNA recombinase
MTGALAIMRASSTAILRLGDSRGRKALLRLDDLNNACVNATSSDKHRRYVAYYRVSTRAQGRSGLGLEAQQASVGRFLQSVSGNLFAEFTEVESGQKVARPQFNEALRICRIYSATLVIAKLDRLARNVAVTAQLMESGVEFVVADFPQANRLTIHILAAIAEYEAKLISERVKAAIVASKARGVVWGGNRNAPTAHLDEARRFGNEGRRRRAIARAIDLEPVIMELRESGKSLEGIAAELNRLGIRLSRGGINWTPNAVRNALSWSAPLFPTRNKWNRFAQRFE